MTKDEEDDDQNSREEGICTDGAPDSGSSPEAYLLEEANQALFSKESIIKILRQQLNSLQEKHKQSIDDTEHLSSRYESLLEDYKKMKSLPVLDKIQGTGSVNCSFLIKEKVERMIQNKDKVKSAIVESVGESESSSSSSSTSVSESVSSQHSENPSSDARATTPIITEEDDQMHKQDTECPVTKIISSANCKSLIEKLNSMMAKSEQTKTMIKGENNGEVALKFRALNNDCTQELAQQFGNIEKILTSHNEKLDLIRHILQKDTPQEVLSTCTDLVSPHKSQVTVNIGGFGKELYLTEIEDIREQLDLYKRMIRSKSEEVVNSIITSANVGMENRLDGHDDVLKQKNEALKVEVKRLKAQLDDCMKSQAEAHLKHQEVLQMRNSLVARMTREQSVTSQSNNEHNELKRQNIELKEKTRDLENIAKKRKEEVEDLGGKIKYLRKDFTEINGRYVSAEGQLKELEENMDATNAMLRSCECVIERLENNNKLADKALQQVTKERDALRDQMQNQNKMTSQQHDELNTKKCECENLKRVAGEMERQVHDLERQIGDNEMKYQNDLAVCTCKIENMETMLRSSSMKAEELQSYSKKLSTTKTENDNLRASIASLQTEMKRMREQHEAEKHSITRAEVEQLEVICESLEKKLAEGKEEMAKKASAISGLHDENKRLSCELEKFKSQLCEQQCMNNGLKLRMEDCTDEMERLAGKVTKDTNGVGRMEMCARITKQLHSLTTENTVMRETITEMECEIRNLRHTLHDKVVPTNSGADSFGAGVSGVESTMNVTRYDQAMSSPMKAPLEVLHPAQSAVGRGKSPTGTPRYVVGGSGSSSGEDDKFARGGVNHAATSSEIESTIDCCMKNTTTCPRKKAKVQGSGWPPDCPVVRPKTATVRGGLGLSKASGPSRNCTARVSELSHNETEIEQLLVELHTENEKYLLATT